eukprot:1577727-Prymnesium_polylepis.1
MESPRVPKRKLPPAGIAGGAIWPDDEESLQGTALVRGVLDEDIDLLLAELEHEDHEDHEDELSEPPPSKRQRDAFAISLDLDDEWSPVST